MLAAMICGHRDIRVEMVEGPSIQKNEILVKVKACGICGTDIHAYKMGNTSVSKESLILGHEFSGEIAEVGPAVDGLRARYRSGMQGDGSIQGHS